MNQVHCPRMLQLFGITLSTLIIYASITILMDAPAFNTRVEGVHHDSGMERMQCPLETFQWSWHYMILLHFMSVLCL